MAGLDVPTSGLRITSVAGVSMNTHAWRCLNQGVIRVPGPKRRTNTLIPNQPGKRGNRAVRDEAVYSLQMLIVGDAEPDGTPVTDQRVGFEANLAEFIDTVVEADEDEYGTVEGKAVTAAGVEVTIRVQADGLLGEDDGGQIEGKFVLSVRVPAGRWV